jgi:hypothetical protein
MFLKSSFFSLAVVVSLSFGVASESASAQTAQLGQRTPDMRLPGVRFPTGKTIIEVPFEVEGSWIVIPVSINSRPLRFVLDTGAQGRFSTTSTMDSLNLNIVGKMPVRGAAAAVRSERLQLLET